MENLPEDRPITCRDTTWLVSAARDGELDEAGHAALQKHIADCPFCREASHCSSKQRKVAERFLGGMTFTRSCISRKPAGENSSSTSLSAMSSCVASIPRDRRKPVR